MHSLIHSFRHFLTSTIKMSSKISIEAVKQNAETAKRTIIELKNELNTLNTEYNNIRAIQLREENAKLLLAVEEAKKKLVDLEVKNGVDQIPIPSQNKSGKAIEPTSEPIKVSTELKPPPVEVKEAKPKKEKKLKETKEKATGDSELVDVGRLDLRIAKVEDVQRHPDADTLYVLKINCGEDKPRTVCSGLVKHVPIDQLKDCSVMLLCNLKPVKMRGITSEAMVMCASTGDTVEVLKPPNEAVAGEFVECEGYARRPDAVMNPKKKIFEAVAPDLHTNEKSEACYKGTPFQVPGKGPILSKTLRNVPVK